MKNFLRKISVLLLALVSVYFFGCQESIVEVDDTAPAPVTNVSAVSEEGKIVITWNDPSDTDLYGIKIYDPEVDASRKALIDGGILVSKGVQKYEAAGLENGKYYSFKLTAIDSSMNESTSVSTLFTVFNEKIVKVKTEEETDGEEIKDVKKFICPIDGKEYDTIEEAANCCEVEPEEPETKEVILYVCPACKKQYSTKKAAADCCKTPIENIPEIYINKEISTVPPVYKHDACSSNGTQQTITSYCFEDSKGELHYTKDSTEADSWKADDLKWRGEFTVTSTPDGLQITSKMDPKYKKGTLNIANKSLGWVENVRLSNAIEVSGEGKNYTYPFVKPGDEYAVWFYCSDENWESNWDVFNGRIEINAIGGKGNYAVRKDDYFFDNDTCSIYLKNLSVTCPVDLTQTAILENKQLSGSLYYDSKADPKNAYKNYLCWSDKIYMTHNRIDLSAVKNQILNKKDVFADVAYEFKYEDKTYECKILGENQFFSYSTEAAPFTVSLKGGTIEQQYGYLKPTIEKSIDILKKNTAYKLPIIYVTTYDSADVLEKEYYDCYVEMFNCGDFAFSEKKAEIKVRGNSTSQGNFKPYRIKFYKKQNMLGLHEGKKFKSWVLLNTNAGMDYVGFNLARKIYESSTDYKYYASDCTFVHVYVNGEYKGMRLLCEQSQTGKDRVDITELQENDGGTLNTGYLLLLDNYAYSNQIDTPCFSLNYPEVINFKYQNRDWQLAKPVTVNGTSLKFENGIKYDVYLNGYTSAQYPQETVTAYKFTDVLGHEIRNMNKDWDNNGAVISEDHYLPDDMYSIKSDTYSNAQICYIGKWLNNVWEICYQAIVNKKIYRMNGNHELEVVPGGYSDDTAKSIISDYIDLESFMNEFILEELVRDNDVGAGSFYMAVDLSKSRIDKYGRLTFECPWDFNWAYHKYSEDSTFFGSGPKYYAGAYQPLYVLEDQYERSNYWFTLFNTAPWFRTMIRERWNRLPKTEIKAFCDSLKTKAATAEKEGYFSVSDQVNFVKERVDEIDQTLWKN